MLYVISEFPPPTSLEGDIKWAQINNPQVRRARFALPLGIQFKVREIQNGRSSLNSLDRRTFRRHHFSPERNRSIYRGPKQRKFRFHHDPCQQYIIHREREPREHQDRCRVPTNEDRSQYQPSQYHKLRNLHRANHHQPNKIICYWCQNAVYRELNHGHRVDRYSSRRLGVQPNRISPLELSRELGGAHSNSKARQQSSHLSNRRRLLQKIRRHQRHCSLRNALCSS